MKKIALYIQSLIVCLLVSIAAGCPLLAQETIDNIKKKFTDYQEHNLQEKMYVHTDKNFYLCGEICWFKIYNVDLFFHRPIDVSKVAYVEILDKNNRSVLRTKIALDGGKGNGSFQLPVTLPSGNYLFRAYSNWMKNFSPAFFFEKAITIVNTRRVSDTIVTNTLPTASYAIQFFPEGGNLVAGLASRVAFKIVDQHGRSVNGTGFVRDDRSDTIARFQAAGLGMGSFMFTPMNGRQYTAYTFLPDGSTITTVLPTAITSGYVMHLDASGSQLKVNVHASSAMANSLLYLFVQTRGLSKMVLEKSMHHDSSTFVLDTSRLGDGISQLTVFDAAGRPVCERLYFKRPTRSIHIQASTDQASYAIRKKITLQLNTVTELGRSSPADVSLAVYRLDSLHTEDAMDINTYLWLTGDLVGPVESPSVYLDGTPVSMAAADNLMLTQGWRRFKWDDILHPQKPAFQFVPEYKGHIIRGRITQVKDGQPVRAVESFLSVAGTRTQVRNAISDDSGYVHFEMRDFYGNNEIIVQESRQAEGRKQIEIASPYASDFSGTRLPVFAPSQKLAATLQENHLALQVLNTYTGNKLKQEAVPVSVDTNAFYLKPDATYFLDDYVRFTTMEEVLREYVPDVNVRRKDGRYSIPVFDNIRKEFFKTSPLILLDGVPVFDADKIMNYDPLKIRKLEVVARMYFYGNMFFGGIVNFVTYHGDLPGFELDPHATVIDYETLQQQREFYSPAYPTALSASSRLPDFRTLLYWSPSVKINSSGQQQVSFFSSDLGGHFAIVIQGMSDNGRTGSKTIYVDVQSPEQLPASALTKPKQK